MFTTVRSRLILIAGLLLVCGWALIPKKGPTGDRISPLSLGLDLQGGMHLAIEIDNPNLSSDERADAIDRALTTIRNRIDEFGVREPAIQKVGRDRIIVELAGIDDPARAKAIVEQTAFLEFQLVSDGTDFLRALPRIDRAIVAELGADAVRRTPIPKEVDLSEILGGRDTTGAEPDSAGLAEEDTVVAAQEVAANDQDLRPLSSLLLESGSPGQFIVEEQEVPTVERFLALEAVQGQIPRDIVVRWGTELIGSGAVTYRTLYALEAKPILTGEELADAGPANRDPTFNRPIVPFETTRKGARLFERETSRHVGDNMAIVLDRRVQSVAVIRETLSRRAQIELAPNASFQEAQDLALVLRAGALPQPIKIVEERTIGPSLGADSIRAGTLAFGVGIVAVVLVMLAYYRVSGAMAVLALGMYIVFVLGGLAGLGATLTLPGIAGLILSVGMAVDANVLIFERIREEIVAGKTPRTAVEAGFANAMSAIVDANLTTLITGIILFQFGTGPVRGFAVTLCMGIVASFFSALFVTRTFFMVYLDRRAPSAPVSI